MVRLYDKLNILVERHEEAQKARPRKLPEVATQHFGDVRLANASGIERGVRNVSLVNIEKISRGLKTNLPRLFEKV